MYNEKRLQGKRHASRTPLVRILAGHERRSAMETSPLDEETQTLGHVSHAMNTKDRNVVSVLSLAASAIAVICFVTGRTSLSDFTPGRSAAAPASVVSLPSRPPAPINPVVQSAQTEQMLAQAAFFVHYGHLPGHGTDDYDADDTENDRQKLIGDLETFIASASVGLAQKDNSQQKKQLARAQSLHHALGQMKPAAS